MMVKNGLNKTKIKRIQRFISGLLLLVLMGNHLGLLPLEEYIVKNARAQAENQAIQIIPAPPEETEKNKLGLIAILVEEDLMNDFALRSRILTYADSAQARIPHSKSFVLEVNKNEDTFRIASMLEKLYFEGIDTDLIDGNPLNNNLAKDDDNQLIGTVLIGDVPIPVVHEKDGTTGPSLYPYTDFYRKAYIYDHASGHFIANDKVSAPSPEIWHGLIVPPSKKPQDARTQLIEYFDKNYEFTQGNDDYDIFEQRVLYANFPEMEKQTNYIDYRNYGRFIKYAEEMIMRRFNKHLLKELVKEVSSDMGSPDTPIIDDTTVDNMYDVHTETIFNKYAYNLAEALRIYRSGINENIIKTGRWSAGQVDSPESLISQRDLYAINEIKSKQLMLEKEVDDYVKNTVSPPARMENIVTGANLNVKLTIEDLDVDSRTFHFESFMDGQKSAEITNADQCGMRAGQAREQNQSVLENNSVLVKANRMYNPETLVKGPNDDSSWRVENTMIYKLYGGCLANNSIYLPQTGSDPAKCRPDKAILPLFDILGSIEVSPEEAVNLAGRCDVQNMTFIIPNPKIFETATNNLEIFGIDLSKLDDSLTYEYPYKANAALGIVGLKAINKSLIDVLNDTYPGLLGQDPQADILEKGSYVVQHLLATGQTYSYSPEEDVVIKISASSNTKLVDTLYAHVEPSDQTVQAITHYGEPRLDPVTGEAKLPKLTTPSTPADGIRFLSFAKNGLKQAYEYVNLFRIDGNNAGEVIINYLDILKTKQQELNEKTGAQSNLFNEFFVNYTSLTEPLIWKAESVDQKLAEIIPKYLDRGSFMPTPNKNPKVSPQNKPNGYEVLHVVAEGDALGYQFGLNRAMLTQSPGTGEETEQAAEEETANETGTGETGGAGTGETGGAGDEGNFICGDPAGVEIWEWFNSLQCWIENEVLPAEKLFSFSQTCNSAPLPPEEKDEPDDIFARIIPTANSFEVSMKRKSLVKGQTEDLTISALNAEGQSVLGYIDAPFNFSADKADLGDFSENGVYIYSGEKTINFTALETGSTSVTVTMGDSPDTRTFTISIFDKIDIDWKAVEVIKNGQSEFTISVSLMSPNGGAIQNINDTIFLAPLQPADGGFENGGRLKLTNGTGSIKFMPAPGKKSITLISKDEYITGEPFVISPTASKASQILLKAPAYLKIGEVAEISVIAADAFGFTDESFSHTISLSLDEKTTAYATLANPSVTLTKGVGTLKIHPGKETADINLTATHPNLKTASISLPLLARVDSGDWKATYPQNLFASFVGFPAGDFTQEDYFGGTHLFSGKTEAVYSFLTAPTPEATLTISPNNLIAVTKPSHKVYVEFPGNEILLQAFDQKAMRTLVSKKIPLDFDSVEIYDNQAPVPGQMLIEILSADFAAIKENEKWQIKSYLNEDIAEIQTNRIQKDNRFQWAYEPQPEFDAIELKLTDGVTVAARLILAFKPETQNPKDFEEINPTLNASVIYSGRSINDPTGLTFYAQDAEVKETVRNEFYGLMSKEKYISLFASGTNAGDAVKFNMPVNAVLLGDPTIKLKTKSDSSLNYNRATGQQLYEDPEGRQITSINHFNFNNDGYQDIALLTEDGRVRLLQGGPTEPPYKDKGNMAFLVDGGIALETFDFEKDNHEDLLVATEEGRLAILHNNQEVITRSDQTLNIGKKIYRIIKADMDQDGYGDLIILDSRGDLFIFYYDPNARAFPENGKWLWNYGYSLKLGVNLRTDLDIRYTGIPEPSEPGEAVLPTQNKPPIEGYEIGGKLDETGSVNYFKSLTTAHQIAIKDPLTAAQNNQAVPKLPWPEGDQTETYFSPIESVGALNVIKSVGNKERPGEKNVDLEETLTFTIEINSGATLNNAIIADTIPDALSLTPDSVTCQGSACDNFDFKQNGIRVFFSGLNLKPGQKTIIQYNTFVAHTPAADILIQKVTEPNENLTLTESIIDGYTDILVSPPYNNTGKLFIHYTTAPRSYERTESNTIKSATTKNSELINSQMQQMNDYGNGNFDQNNLPPSPKFDKSAESALNEATGNNACFDATSCAEEAMDKLGEKISGFSCMGGGCFPMPFNMAFLVPPAFPLPAFAFPTTLPTPIPVPVPSVFGVPSVLGMASIPGPYMSAIRFYVSPTLTGGIGLAMCWGLYPMAPVVPPPVYPIPYPPPIGNCMVTALPADSLPYGSLCEEIEKQITSAMDMVSAGVNKVQTGISDTASNVPGASVETVGPEQGAGGLEISLGMNLGNSQKFDPPAKAFSNVHIPTFDSIGGVLSGWFDRQVLEIKNKLLTMPTMSVYLPDFKSLFALDWRQTEKAFEAWKNTASGSTSATAKAIEKIDNLDLSAQEKARSKITLENLGPSTRGVLEDAKGSKFLKYMDAVETQASIYNLSTLEGIYDVASTLPMVKLTEKPIQVNIPWLSAAEIQAWITQAENWIIYYEREYDRVKDKWEAISCEDLPDGADTEEQAENAGRCALRHAAEMFGANFDPLINSVKENIAVLQSYLNFPKELMKFKEQLADYIRVVACYLDEFGQLMGGWMATLQQQVVSWAELIITIAEIVNNLDKLFDLFTNFDASCNICTNERYANFGWWMLLGLVLPDIPVIQFPKIPDIVLDMSNMDAMLDIELPVLNIRPMPIPLPPLPYLRLPDLPSFSLVVSLPPLPILPKPPELPDLPPLPPLPTIDLPTLPVPPKLPDVTKPFEAIIPIIEKILKLWCIMKKSFAPVPEQMLNDQITLLTNRPAYLIPLDLLKLQLPTIAPFDLGFNELRIETVLYLGLRLNLVSKPLENWAKIVNRWTEEIPDTLNKVYQDWIIEKEAEWQAWLDDQGAKLDKAVAEAEKDAQDAVQGAIDDSIGKKFGEWDDWMRDQEAAWQDYVDKQEGEIGDWLKEKGWTYKDYAKAVQNMNEKVENIRGGWGDAISDWLAEHHEFMKNLNYTMPLIPVLEYMSEGSFEEDMQEILDLTSQKLNEAAASGPIVIQRLYLCLRNWSDCKNNQDRYFGSTPPSASAPRTIAQVRSVTSTPSISEEEYAKQMLETPQGQEIKSLLAQMTEEIQKVNKNEPVDYKVIKEKWSLPNFEPNLTNDPLEKLETMRAQLIRQSDQLIAEASALKGVKDLTAIAGVPPQNTFNYQLAEASFTTNVQPETVHTNALPATEINKPANNPVEGAMMELEQKIERTSAQLSGTTGTTPSTGSCNAAFCLPDPITESPIPVIPYIDLIARSETLFMPNGNLVYSDGTGIYLKRDLTLNDEEKNTNTGHPQRFTFDQMKKLLRMPDNPKEAVNMLQSTFTENGAATFTWNPTAHPSLYGYGIELERTVTGYDTDRQNNQLADTKILLLPADEEGQAPEVTVNGEKISFGTLVTSLTDRDEAAERFGVSPHNIVTGAKEVRFPTISNALIKLNENKAVYFDQYNGSAYTMRMENGYYQIKMTWFDEKAGTATYNHNEILAPQIYAGAADPIDVSQTDTYYMPILKEKVIQASDIFVDLAGVYKYYWYINPDSNQLTPQMGRSLTIPPQKEEKTFKVKLVATQNLADFRLKTFEKTFNIKVYTPTINLDSEELKNGIIAGNMTPIPQAANDDLSDIPFSVFRKRLGTWKNIGILRAEDPEKNPTNPALGENQSYYSVDAAGTYFIEGFEILDPSPVLLKDGNGNVVAEVKTENGLINLKDPAYELKAVPGGTNTPTHIAIIKKETSEILGNVYYIAATENDVSMLDEALTSSNVESSGVTLGDANTNDEVIAANIPGSAPSFPGGAALFEEDSKENVALIDKDGTVRIMKAGYELRIKNPDSTSEPYIFQIATSDGSPVYDLFIQADFENLQVDSSTNMNSLNIQIGFLPKTIRAYAQSTESPPVPEFRTETEKILQLDGSPFPDLDKTHPYFNQILELYKSRVISGYGDGTFKPDQKLTRAEFIKIALGVTNCVDCTTPNEAIKEKYLNNPFPDVFLPSWYFYCISIAKELGMVTGYGDGFFRPERNISRAEAAAVLLRQSGIVLTEAPEAAYKDVPDYAWYVDYVYTAVQIGLIKESFGFVNPDEEITRGEFAFMAAGVKDLKECRLVDTDGDGTPDWWEMTHGMDLFTPDLERSCPCYDSPWTADTDGDGVKDVCDLDIDNDGILNPMCILTDTGEVDPIKLAEGSTALQTQAGEKIDNCIFVANEDQADYDGNQVGNLCEPIPVEVCPCLDNPNQNDTDNDGIRDVCDNDIDNDGITQPICIFDDSGLLDPSKLRPEDDNCSFVINTDQQDQNKNGAGDACETGLYEDTEGEKDGEGGPSDLCPDAPEDLDGVDDDDGCPELVDNFPETEPGVYSNPGELCSFIDFATDFNEDDVFMTAITDLETHEILHSQSQELTFSQ